MQNTIVIASAYGQLTPVERAFAERVVRSVCVTAERENLRPQDVLARPMDVRTLGEDGGALIGRVVVQAAIVELVRDIGSVGAITLDGIAGEIWNILHSNIDDFLLTWSDGRREDVTFENVSRDKLSAIKSYTYEVYPDGRTKKKFEFHSKIEAAKVALDIVRNVPEGHKYKNLSVTSDGPSTMLPADITHNEAAERYARRLALS